MNIIFFTFQIHLHCSRSHYFIGILKFPIVMQSGSHRTLLEVPQTDGHPKWGTQHPQARQNRNREEREKKIETEHVQIKNMVKPGSIS